MKVGGATLMGGKILGGACATGSVLLFASFTLASRVGLTTDYATADLALMRFGIAALLLLPLFWRRGLSGQSLARACTLAATGGLGFALLAYEGFRHAPASHAAVLLHGTLPLFGVLFGVVVLRERVSRLRLAGAALIGLGMATVLASGWRSGGTAAGHAYLLAASAAWTLYGALLARWRVKATDAVAMVAALSFVAYGAYVLASGHVLNAVPDSGFAVQALVQGVLIGALSLFLFSKAVETLGATRAALAVTAVPVITALGGIALLAEVPTPAEWAGVALAVLGMGTALWRA
jgi:drug/metabolite transporter (DMT)-like permease